MNLLLEFMVVRNNSYSEFLEWKCPLCGTVGNSYHQLTETLIKAFEKHLKLFHNLEPEEAPF